MIFDLSEALAQAMSKPDTGREQIEYIDLNLICPDPNNFYQLSGIEDLAANIAMCGLQQPIRVRKHPEEEGRYMIVSGHRRYTALETLVKDDSAKWSEVPCIVQREDVSQELQQLQLIYANAHTREMSNADKMEQAKQVEQLLYQLKEQGYEFPGKMRDHVAEAVKVSSTKLARLKVIQKNLEACWRDHFKADDIGESVAYALAQMPKSWQQIVYEVWKDKPRQLYESTAKRSREEFERITQITCSHGCPQGCDNAIAMMRKCANLSSWSYNKCRGCCFDCEELASCKSSCHLAADKKKQLQQERREAKRAEAEADAAKEKPDIDLIQEIYRRVGEARKASKRSVEDLYHSQKRMYANSDYDKQVSLEKGTAKVSPHTSLPFGYSFYVNDARNLVRVAECLGCSIDWLLGRDVPGPGDSPSQSAMLTAFPEGEMRSGWQTGEPEFSGEYAVLIRWQPRGNLCVDKLEWMADAWRDHGELVEELGAEVCYWMPFPEEK